MYQKKQEQENGRTLRAVALIAILAAVILLGCFGYTKYQEYREEKVQESLKDLFEGSALNEQARGSLFPRALAEELPAVEDKCISQRMAELWTVNQEVIGWLEMGENISTPVVYRDNEYYLDHDFYGNESVSGTVFADVANDEWETDPYIVLYGHNMKNGSMFGTLDQYQELDYFLENTNVTFYSVYNDEVVQYVPFAVVDASMDKDHAEYLKIRSFSCFKDPEDLSPADEFIEALLERSIIEIPGVEVTSEDRILAMVTCTYKLPNARLTVFCRALREGETAEQMTEFLRENARQRQ